MFHFNSSMIFSEHNTFTNCIRLIGRFNLSDYEHLYHFAPLLFLDTSGCVDKTPRELNYPKLPYMQEIERSTSGRGAKASYRTMLPEISARRSLLEPSFRYLSPGRKGEKCRPLEHMRQIPLIHLDRFLT